MNGIHEVRGSIPLGSTNPMPIIVGAARSGTTLLRFMLDAHPELAIPPETGFLTISNKLRGNGHKLRKTFFEAVTNFPEGNPTWPDFEISKDAFWAELIQIEKFNLSDGFRAFYRLYANRFGKSRWGDKTPIYCKSLEPIRQVLPESHFVHIIRDGRDVALSLRQMWFSPGNDIETLASYWRDCVLAARRAGAGRRDYIEVRYEDLIQHTEANLVRICDFLKLRFVPGMLNYYTRVPERLKEHKGRLDSKGIPTITHQQRLKQQARTMDPPDAQRVFAWKGEMSSEERQTFADVAGELLQEIGYEV